MCSKYVNGGLAMEGSSEYQRVTLNIGGDVFVTTIKSLQAHPGTKISSLTQGDPSYDQVDRQFYFDRSPRMFVYILEYYRSGELHFPKCLCGKVVKQELEFWKIPETAISECCWLRYQDFYEELHSMEDVSHVFEDSPIQQQYNQYYQKNNKVNQLRHSIWLLLEWPNSSIIAKIWSCVFMVLVLASIGILCCETHPMFRVPLSHNHSGTNITNLTFTNTKLTMFYTTDLNPILVWIDSICTAIFLLEFITKLLVWPHRKIFFLNFYNTLDMLSVIPMFILTLIDVVSPHFWLDNDIFFGYSILSLCSVFRAVRVMKIVKHNRGLQIIFLAIKACWKELFLLVILMAIGMVVFSTMIYFAEFHQKDNTFSHIPIGFWWSIVTMTTVGYGDKHPSSGLGYMVGGGCALAGMLVTGLPIPLIANSFNLYYTYAKVKAKLMQRNSEAKISHDPLSKDEQHIDPKNPNI